MLEAAIALQIGLGEFIEAALIGGLLLFNATLGFLQEGRAGAALAALRKRLAPTAVVRRDGEWVSFLHPNLYRAISSGCRLEPWCPPMRPSRPDR